ATGTENLVESLHVEAVSFISLVGWEIKMKTLIKVSPEVLRHAGRVKRGLCFCSYNQDRRNRNFARQDTYFLEDCSRSGLRCRSGFIVAGALRRLLRALS